MNILKEDINEKPNTVSTERAKLIEKIKKLVEKETEEEKHNWIIEISPDKIHLKYTRRKIGNLTVSFTSTHDLIFDLIEESYTLTLIKETIRVMRLEVAQQVMRLLTN